MIILYEAKTSNKVIVEPERENKYTRIYKIMNTLLLTMKNQVSYGNYVMELVFKCE